MAIEMSSRMKAIDNGGPILQTMSLTIHDRAGLATREIRLDCPKVYSATSGRNATAAREPLVGASLPCIAPECVIVDAGQLRAVVERGTRWDATRDATMQKRVKSPPR